MRGESKTKDKKIPGTAQGRGVFASVMLIVLLSGCINPFSGSGNDEDAANPSLTDGKEGGNVKIALSGGVEGATVAPDGAALTGQVAYYNLELTEAEARLDPIRRTGLSAADFPVNLQDVPAATWNATLSAYDGTDRLIGRSPVTSVTVSSGTTSLALTVTALQTGKGATFQYNLSWPTPEVDAASVTLYRVDSIADPLGSGTPVSNFSEGDDYELSLMTGTLTVDTERPSGAYYLEVVLSIAGVAYPPVYEAVQLYDYLTSSKSVNLTESEFTDAPAAPTDLSYTLTGDGAYRLDWTDQSNMEREFRIYENSLAANPLTNAGGVTTRSLTGTPGESVTWFVTAANDFGESAAISITITVVGNQAADTPTDGDPWVRINTGPGTLEWSDVGADRWDVYLSATENQVQNLDPGARIATDADVTSITMPPLERGIDYYWRVVSKRADADGGVISPILTFSSRTAQIHVNGDSGNDTTGDGSTTAPYRTLATAMDEAVDAADLGSADTIRLTDTVVQQDGTFEPNKTVVIEGGWSADFGGRNDVTVASNRTNWSGNTNPDTVIRVPGGPDPVDLVLDGLNIRTRGAGVDVGAVDIQGASRVVVRNSLLAAENPSADVVIVELGTGSDLELRSVLVDLNESGDDTNTVKGVANTAGSDVGDVIILDSKFQESQAASFARYHVHIQGSNTGSLTIDGSDFTFSYHRAYTAGVVAEIPTLTVGTTAAVTMEFFSNGYNIDGIQAIGTSEVDIEQTTLRVNEGAVGDGAQGRAIVVEAEGTASIRNNTIDFGSFTSGIAGVEVTGSGSNVSINNNQITGGQTTGPNFNWHGIHVDNPASTVYISDNTVEDGISLDGSAQGIYVNALNDANPPHKVTDNVVQNLTGGTSTVGNETYGLRFLGRNASITANTIRNLNVDDTTSPSYTGPRGLFLESQDTVVEGNRIELTADDNDGQVGILTSEQNVEIDKNTIVMGSALYAATPLLSVGVRVRSLDTRLTNNIIVKNGAIEAGHEYRAIQLDDGQLVGDEVFEAYIYHNTIIVDSQADAVAPGQWVAMEFRGGADGLQPDIRNNLIVGLDNAADQEAAALQWTEVAPQTIRYNRFVGISTFADNGQQLFTNITDLNVNLFHLTGNNTGTTPNAFDATTYAITSGYTAAGGGEDLTNGISVGGNPIPGVTEDRFSNNRTPGVNGGVSIGAEEVD